MNVRELSGGSGPIAMATGYLRQYQSMVQIRQQVCDEEEVLTSVCLLGVLENHTHTYTHRSL